LQILDPLSTLVDEGHTALDEANEGATRRREWRWSSAGDTVNEPARFLNRSRTQWRIGHVSKVPAFKP